jgi:hypothetical protein
MLKNGAKLQSSTQLTTIISVRILFFTFYTRNYSFACAYNVTVRCFRVINVVVKNKLLYEHILSVCL